MSCLQLLDSYYLLIHVGSSISRLGGLLERSDRLGSVVYDWVEVGLPSGIDAGTLLRMKRRFRISTLPCLVLIWYCRCGPMQWTFSAMTSLNKMAAIVWGQCM